MIFVIGIDVNQQSITKHKLDCNYKYLGAIETGVENPSLEMLMKISNLYATFESETEARNFISYLKTKTFRALVLACRIEQHLPNKTYRFVPLQDFTKPWTDEELYAKYNLTADEIAFIEATIKPME